MTQAYLKDKTKTISEATEKLYYISAYDREFDGKILLSFDSDTPGKKVLIFDRTLFFPEEGGQTCDKGFITVAGRTYRVEAVSIVKTPIGEVIAHEISSDDSFEAFESVHGRIDWDERFSNMQNHSGEHMFSGIVKSRFGYENVGFHLSQNTVTMDYNGPISDEDAALIEKKVNRLIWENRKVKCFFPSQEELEKLDYRSKKEIDGAVRLVEIEGVDLCACCAPHVRLTGEIGGLIILSRENYKGGTRFSILCGERARLYSKENETVLNKVSRNLKTPFSDIPENVEKLQKEIQTLKSELSSKSGELLKTKFNSLDKSVNKACIRGDKNDLRVGRHVLNDVMKERSGLYMIIAGNGNCPFILASSDMDCRSLAEELKSDLNIKSGGVNTMIQGTINNPIDQVLPVLKERGFTLL